MLSKKFYEKFGEDVTNELVNWFNTVDATYKADIKQLNEGNFQRFEATLKQGLAEPRLTPGRCPGVTAPRLLTRRPRRAYPRRDAAFRAVTVS